MFLTTRWPACINTIYRGMKCGDAEVQHVIFYFKLKSMNNDVSTTMTRMQIVKKILFQQRIPRTYNN